MADTQARIVLTASDKTRAAFESAKNNLRGVSTAAVATGGVLAAAFSGVGLAGLVTRTTQAVDVLNDTADAAGSSVEMISALDDLARRTGTTLDSVTGILVKFNGVLSDAKPGSSAEALLKGLGLQAEELRRLDPAEALRQVAVAMATFEDDANKARLTQELFGRSVREAAPFLKDLAEQGELNAKITTAQAQEAEKFNRELTNLQANVENAARSLVNDMLPALNSFLVQWREIGGLSGAVTATLGLDSKGRLETRAREIQDDMTRTGDAIARMQEELNRDPGNDRLALRIDKARQRLEALSRQANVTSDNLKALANGIDPQGDTSNYGNEGRNAGRRSVGTVPDKAKKTASESVRAFTDYQAMIDAAVGNLLEDADITRAQVINDQMAKLYALFEAGLPADLIAQAQGKLRGGALVGPELPEEEVKRRKELNDLLAATPTAQLEEARRQMLLLADAFQRGDIGAEQFEEAATAALGNVPDQAAKAIEGLDEFAKQAARNIQDSLGSTLASSLKGDFDNIGEAWGNLLIDMAAQAAAAQIGQFLFGDFAKTGNIGGVAADLFAGFAGFFAEGGKIGAGQWGIAGEAGPEIIEGPATVTPLSSLPARSAASAGAITLNNTVYVDSRSDAGSIRAAVDGMLNQRDRALFDQLRAMGVIA